MTHVGQTYQPAGPIDVRAVLTTVILGAFTAVIAAVPIWLWEISPVPTFLIVSTAAQAGIIGVALKFMVGRLRMRNPRLVGAIAFACGLASVTLVHYGHYLHFIHKASNELRVGIRNDPELTPEQKRGAEERIDRDAFTLVNQVLQLKAGRSGFLGFMRMRNEAGVRLRRMPVSGVFLWLLWGGEAVFAGYLARSMAVERASKPFCEDCGYWCNPEPDRFTLPAEVTDPIAEAVRGDDPARLIEIRQNPPDDINVGLVGVTLYACPGCDQAFADVSYRVHDDKKLVTKDVVKHVRVSPEMADAVRNEPPPPTPPAAEGPAGDEIQDDSQFA